MGINGRITEEDQNVIEEAAKAGHPVANFIKHIMKEEKGLYGGSPPEISESSTTNKIIIPKNMNELEASKELKRKWDSEEEKVELVRNFSPYRPEDVMVAIKRVSEREFGYINGKTEVDMWGNVKRPTYTDVTVNMVDGVPMVEKCFYGKFTVTAWENAEAHIHGSTMRLTSKKRYEKKINAFFELVQTELHENSIYKGKTVVVTKGGPWGLEFEIIEVKKNDKIILNDNEEASLSRLILPDLEEDGKRIYLFTGPYGNGKTESAMRVAEVANKLNQSFFYIKDNAVFHDALTTAKIYGKSVVFMEDVDEEMSGEERDSAMNNNLNTLDGPEIKKSDIKVILTTNHAFNINKALRRPGRIDQIILFGNPTIDKSLEIIKVYIKDLKQNVNWTVVQTELEKDEFKDLSGSFIAEIGKRVRKLTLRGGDDNTTSTEIVLDAILSMSYHIKLMNADGIKSTIKDQFFKEITEAIASRVFYMENGYDYSGE